MALFDKLFKKKTEPAKETAPVKEEPAKTAPEETVTMAESHSIQASVNQAFNAEKNAQKMGLPTLPENLRGEIEKITIRLEEIQRDMNEENKETLMLEANALIQKERELLRSYFPGKEN